MRTGVWADFASDDKGGDPVSLVAFIEDCKQGEAALKLARMLGLDAWRSSPWMTIASSRCRTTSASRREPALQAGAPKTMAGIPSFLFPIRFQTPTCITGSSASLSRSWLYRDANGGRLCFIGRYNKADGEKEFWPRTWWKNRKTGEEEWRWKNVPDPRPLYGLELLAQRPNAPVMVVEGEGKCDVARRIFPDHVVVSPMNGARSPHKADWSPLRARDVTICGDNDKPGEAFVQIVGRILVGLGCKVSVVDIAALVALAVSARGSAVKADGFDIADAALLWEEPESLRAAVFGLVQPFVPTLDLAELERGEQAAFDLLIERCKSDPSPS